MASTATFLGRAWAPRRARLQEWFVDRIHRRRGPTTLPFTFEYRHIYVLPTAFGSAFGVMLVAMALGGLNFNNNMALLIVFLLASVAQLTTLLSYRNLVGLRLDGIRAEPVFAGDRAHFQVHAHNPDDRPRYSLQAGAGEVSDCEDVPPLSSATFRIDVAASRRGWLTMPAFRLETRFPLGLFQAWTWYFPRARCLVYPKPAAHPPPLPKTGAGQAGRARQGDGDEVHGLRKYRPGDSPKRVAWRASARHDRLLSLEMETPREESCEIGWDALPGVEAERRLSILTAWVLIADHKQIPYRVELPGVSIESGLGAEHREAALQAIALHGL